MRPVKRLAALVAVLALAGCGGAAKKPAPAVPKLPRALASAWRAQADGVAAALASGDGCLAEQRMQALQQAVIDAVNARTVPGRFQEPLLGAVNDLAGRISCTPPPAPAPTPPEKQHPPHPPHGHGHGHGKGPKH